MTRPAFATHTFHVGMRKCTMTVQIPEKGSLTNVVCEWDPGLPERQFTDQELRQYRAGRDKVLNEIAKVVGQIEAQREASRPPSYRS